MKKFFMMIGLLFLPFSVSAISGDFMLTCDKDVLSPGQSTTCSIDGVVVDGSIGSFIGTVSLGDGLTLISSSRTTSVSDDDVYFFEAGDADDGQFDLYSEESLSGKISIGKFVVQAGDAPGTNSNISITSSEIGVETDDENVVGMPISIAPVSIRIPSDDNSLRELKVNGSIVEGFMPTKTEYELVFPSNVTETSISAVANETNARITGDTGTKQISYGENNFVINVKAENDSEKQYTVKIVRPEVRELTSLKINDKDIELISGTYKYTYKVDNSVTSVNVVATAPENIDFSEGYGSRTVKDLKVGNNEILVKSVDPNGDELVYTIVVDRLDEKGKDVAPKEDKKPSGTVENPKTGVYGVSFIVVLGSIGAYIVARKKGFIKKI